MMAKSAAKEPPATEPVLRVRLLWKLVEVEGHGRLSVLCAVAICLLMMSLWIARGF